MKRKEMSNLAPLDPEVKKAGFRILENAFGKFGPEGGTPSELRRLVEEEIIIEHPHLREDKKALENVSRMLMARFFEIVADEPKSPNSKRHNAILSNFIDTSIAKHQETESKEL